jgi:hypothetical protein
MKTSTGEYFGLTETGLFRFNPLDGSVVRIIGCEPCDDPSARVTESLIEICRQPYCRALAPDSVDACLGSAFTLDLQNENATRYAWIKDGAPLPPTTDVLTIDPVTADAAGDYTCTMTNECGTTTVALHLSVGCSATAVSSPLDRAIALFPNPVHNLLNIQGTTELEIATLTITNLLGQTVLTGEGGTTRIDVGKLGPGVYQLRLGTGQGSWNGKFIKE